MSAPASDRRLVLARIRAALADVPAHEPPLVDVGELAGGDELVDIGERVGDAAGVAPGSPGVYRRRLGLPGADRVELFDARLRELGATVGRCEPRPDAIAAAVAAVCSRHGQRELAVAGDLDPAWIPSGVRARRDEPPLERDELEGVGAALTGCALAVAQTGTIVLDGGPGQGRRALTLLVDLHVCVVLAQQLVDSVPEAVRGMAASVSERRAPLTLITGPSATADIELRRVQGVHGPRRLEVVLAV